ncbi:unnamed protein product [Sphagnum balticum]
MEISSLKTVKQVAAGWGHSLALTTHGIVYSWGYGKDGQLGHNNTESLMDPTAIVHRCEITSVYAGHSHSGFIDRHSDYYSFGFNNDYRLMIGDSKTVLAPQLVIIRDVAKAGLGVSHSCVITKAGYLYCGGVGTNGELSLTLSDKITGFEKIEVADRQFS